MLDWRQLLVLLVLFVPLERLLPHRADQPILRPQWTLDAIYLLLNGILIRAGFVAVVALAMPAIDGLVPEALRAEVAGLPLWAQIPLAIVIADLGFYAHHRLFHAVPFLWRFHAIHHSIERLDWLAAHRVHPIDQVASAAMSLLPLYALGFSAEAMAVQAGLYFMQSHLVHSNTRLGLGPFDAVFASPRFHHWHHTNAAAAHDRNFGGQLLVWDRLFGTLHLPAAMPDRYGTDDPVPASYHRQLAWPFLPRSR